MTPTLENLALAKAGDADAIAEIATSNRPLILYVWQRHARSLDMDDAIQVGSIGLLRAIRKHDPVRGAWSTTAYMWVRQALSRELRRDNVIRHSYHESYGDAPSVVWVDAGEETYDLASDTGTPLSLASDADECAALARQLARLDKRIARILRCRFGLDGREPMLLIEIGAELGLTRERVRQLERAGLDTLRREMCA